MSYPDSAQWREGRFRNPDEWPRRSGLRAFLRWQLAGRPSMRPTGFVPPRVASDGKRLRADRIQPSVTWIGHATLLVQAHGVSVLTDPIFSDRISGFVRRLSAPGLALQQLPALDLVVISHNHRDHLDEASVLALGSSVLYAVPLGLGAWFRARGLKRVLELDWWQTEEFAPGAHVTLVPAQHWSQRGVADVDTTLWGCYVIQTPMASFARRRRSYAMSSKKRSSPSKWDSMPSASVNITAAISRSPRRKSCWRRSPDGRRGSCSAPR